MMEKDESQKKRAAARSLVERLVSQGYKALFAGGYVRDMLMGNEEYGDIDIATDATPEEVQKVFSHTVGVGEQFGVMIVIHEGIPFEVATFRSDLGIDDGRHPEGVVFTDPQSDAHRRDFSINGMFYDPIEGKILDYVSGGEDIKRKIIRSIGNPDRRFSEDYLRMLRAIRFAARFNFKIEKNTWAALKNSSREIERISPERIFSEIDKMLVCRNSDQAILLLNESGLLDWVIPEVSAMKGVEQPPEFHPEGDVFVHTLKALGLLKEDVSSVLGWSVLLHDIGKPVTMSRTDRIRFNNHDRIGAAMAKQVLRRLRASNLLIENVGACIENHMNFMNVRKMRLSTLKKFLSRKTILEELELHRVDCLACHGDLENYFFIKEQLENFEQEQIKPQPLIGGRELISIGLEPGPVFGKILSEIYDLQLEEKISTRGEALSAVKEMWKNESMK